MGASQPAPARPDLGRRRRCPSRRAREDGRSRRAITRRPARALLLDYVAPERGGPRVVARTDDWLRVVPFWAAWPFETLLIPRRRPRASPTSTTPRRDGLAAVLRDLIRRYDALFGEPFPYSMGWHQAPFGERAADRDAGSSTRTSTRRCCARDVRKFMVGYELLAETQRDLTPGGGGGSPARRPRLTRLAAASRAGTMDRHLRGGAMRLWGGRFGDGPDARMADFTRSIEVDAELALDDIAGSIAHVRGLGRAGLLTDDEVATLVARASPSLREDVEAGARRVGPGPRGRPHEPRDAAHRAGRAGRRASSTPAARATTRSPRTCGCGRAGRSTAWTPRSSGFERALVGPRRARGRRRPAGHDPHPAGPARAARPPPARLRRDARARPRPARRRPAPAQRLAARAPARSPVPATRSTARRRPRSSASTA